MHILVTGGHGFIGHRLVGDLCRHGHQVTVVDLQPPRESMEALSYEFLEDDLLQPSTTGALERKGFDTVIHLVGLSDTRMAHQNPDYSFRLNVESTENILEVCRKSGVQHVIVPSSAAVYGVTRQLPVPETAPLQPTNVYGYHKVLVEMLVQAYGQNYGIPYTILRLFNVYGRGNAGIIDLCLRKAANREPFSLFGGEQLRDFIYSGDVVAAFTAAVSRKVARNKVINVGSGVGVSIREVASLVQELYSDFQVTFEGQNVDSLYDSVADNRLAQEALGLTPRASQEFLRSVIEKEMIPDG